MFGMAFRKGGAVIAQIQLTKRQDVVPITRDYITSEETRLRSVEAERRSSGSQANECQYELA
jgi:cyclopropane-fatty-acyl-phospholipid synthase